MADFYASTSNSYWGIRASTYEISTNPAQNYSVVRTDLYVGRFNVSNGVPSPSTTSYQYGANYSLRKGANEASRQWGTYRNSANVTFAAGDWHYYGTHDAIAYHNADGSGTYNETFIAQSLSSVKPTLGIVGVSIALTTFSTRPGNPSYISAKGKTSSSTDIRANENVSIIWAAAANAEYYKTQMQYGIYGNWSGFTEEKIVYGTEDIRSFPKNLIGYNVRYIVQAVNSYGASDWIYSNEIYITGNMNYKQENAWKKARMYYKLNGVWVPCAISYNSNGSWKALK